MIMDKKHWLSLGKWINENSVFHIPKDKVDEYFGQIDKLQAENKRLREALELAITRLETGYFPVKYHEKSTLEILKQALKGEKE